jgi:ATP-dependent exoDNAse (exonuclease V) alpha subunit
MVLSGGAGVGKSRTVGAVVAALGADRVILSAPTGKAARRLERSGFSVAIERSPLHRGGGGRACLFLGRLA